MFLVLAITFKTTQPCSLSTNVSNALSFFAYFFWMEMQIISEKSSKPPILVKNSPQPSVDDLSMNQTFISEQLDLYQRSREGAYTLVDNGGNTVAFIPLPHMVSPATLTTLLNQTSSPLDTKLPTTVQQLYSNQRAIQLRQFPSNSTAIQETAFNKGFLPITLLHPLSRAAFRLPQLPCYPHPWSIMTRYRTPLILRSLCKWCATTAACFRCPASQCCSRRSWCLAQM
jgi:hypothetical protein